MPVTVPKYSRYLRFSALPAPVHEGVEWGRSGSANSGKRRLNGDTVEMELEFKFEVAFGLPWSYKSFLEQACKAGHPALREEGVPSELVAAVQKHVE
eukprot:s1543_g23.t1